MFGLLPLVGGVLLGYFAPRRFAVLGQSVLCVVAIAGTTVTLAQRSGPQPNPWAVGVAMAVASAVSLAVGCGLAARRQTAIGAVNGDNALVPARGVTDREETR